VGVQLALVFTLGELARRRPSLRFQLAARRRSRWSPAAWRARARRACGTTRRRSSRMRWRSRSATTVASVGLANERATRGDVEGARKGYEEALAIRPSYAPALYGLGLLEQQHGDPERAIDLYRRASAALPGLAAAELNLGTLLAKRGEQVAAAEAFERVLELYPEHPDAHFDLALLLYVNHQLDAAAEHLEAAVRARPDGAAAWEKLGEVREAQGDHHSALAALEHALVEPSRVAAARCAPGSWPPAPRTSCAIPCARSSSRGERCRPRSAANRPRSKRSRPPSPRRRVRARDRGTGRSPEALAARPAGRARARLELYPRRQAVSSRALSEASPWPRNPPARWTARAACAGIPARSNARTP
jgi:tetratricopeptide (TPR) repeat protein